MKYEVIRLNEYNENGEPLYWIDREISWWQEVSSGVSTFECHKLTKDEVWVKLYNLSKDGHIEVKFSIDNYTPDMFKNKNK